MRSEARDQKPEVGLLPARKRDPMGRFLPTSDLRPLTSGIKNLGGFDGASYWSTSRGYVYYPTLDSKKDLDSYSLYELRRRSRWAVNNIGFASRCIYGKANMVGSLTPVPQTLDQEWNLAALASFNRNASSPLVFDVGGRFDFWSCQPMITSCSDMDGDMLTVLTETQSGVASCMFYEAHQVDNSSATQLDQSQWNNGVRTNPQGRPIGYRIVTGDELYGNFKPSDNGQRSVDIPAGDAAFICKYRRPGRVRGEPALRHAVNNLLDRNEIMAFTKTSIKNASTIGWQVVNNAPYTGGPLLPPRGAGAGPQDITVFDSVTGQNKTIKAENPFGSGKQLEMGPGEELKLLLDQRPHPNQVEFLNYLARDIAWGMDCSPDILWDIAKIGGAQVRYVMADAKRTLIQPGQQLLADQFCTRFWIYYVAKEMKADRLPKCQDPEWWKVDWQPPADVTVDIGRDGKLYLDLHKSGLISPQRFFAQQGQNWQKEMDDYLVARKYTIEKVTELGMTMDQAFPPEPGSANVQVREQAEPTGGDAANPKPAKTTAPTGSPASSRTRPAGILPADPPESPFPAFLRSLEIIAKSNKPAQITVNTPPVNITNNIPEQNLSPVFETKAPVVHVAAAQIKVEAPPPIVIPPAIVNVTNEVNPTPVTITNAINLPRKTSTKFNRDDRGHIVSAETEKD